ncbi:MAG TPA: CPBP family intramembrane glutamic endopeptidase, partial [Longimicrobiales bacterium]|nr:CPBP family intramembrane glutamic endopeptidase [Longimicrobiales bacterium]
AAAGWLVWSATGGLAGPVRAMTTFLLAILPLLVMGQAAMVDEVPQGVSRRLLYRTSSVTLWVLALITVLAAGSGGMAAEDLGLTTLAPGPFLAWTAAALGLGVAGLFVARAAGVREGALLRWLLPRTRAERLEFVGVALTAGITEEVVFRGFLIPVLGLATSSWAAAVLVSSALFGFVHGYQGTSGAVRAGILGLILALPFLATGSLLPSMAAHALIDLVAGIWLAERLTAE